MAYIGTNPANTGTGLFSQDTFTGDGSTVTFDLTNVAPDGGGNELQVFVDNVRQQEGSSNAYTLGFDGSSELKRITFTAAPAASAAIYVLNPGTKNVQQISTVSDNAVTTAKVQDDAITTAKILDSNITTAKIAADAINATKLADDAISEEHLDITTITDQTELAEVAASNDIFLVYDASSGTLKKILSSNVGITPPTFSSVSPTNVNTGDGTGNATFTITGTNFDASATAKLKTTAGVDVNFDSVTRDSATQITGVIAISSLSNANEPYDVFIINGTGLQVTATDQININAQPVYVTAAGSLGDVIVSTAGSFSVNATDPESAGNVTFELQSGALPPGYSITNTAAEGGTAIISGTDSTTSSTTTFNFVLRAVDAASNTTSRAFSIRSRVPVTESFTSSATFSVPSGITSADVLIVAGGGGGAGGDPVNAGGGGGAGGLVFFPAYPLTASGTITVTVGCGGSGGTGSNPGNPGSTAQDSVFGSPGDPGLSTGGVLTAKGGGAGESAGGSSSPGGSGGGGSGPTGGGGVGQGIQPTQPGNSGAYGHGNPGGANGAGPVVSRAGGGGGAGQAGSPGGCCGTPGGEGGDGRAYTIADGTTPVYYAGGGGGGSGAPGPARTGLTGGQGGGGNGGAFNAQGSAGTDTKGGGGGGGSYNSYDGRSGGKGVVIVRY